MHRYFENVIDRRGTDCVKWDGLGRFYADGVPQDAISMWIADYDFPCFEPVRQAMEKRLQQIEGKITVAVMGCAVNGPGEAREADIGVACGEDCGPHPVGKR